MSTVREVELYLEQFLCLLRAVESISSVFGAVLCECVIK